METGQAAGFAAAISIRDDRPVQKIDTAKLVERIRKEGSFV